MRVHGQYLVGLSRYLILHASVMLVGHFIVGSLWCATLNC